MLPWISIKEINHSAGELWAKVSFHDLRVNRKVTAFVDYLKKILFKEVLQLHHKILVQMPLHFLLNFYLDFHILAEKYTSTEQ